MVSFAKWVKKIINHNGTKDFQNQTKIDRDMAKKRIFQNTYVCSFSGNLWRFMVDTSKIGRFIGKKAQKLDSTPITSIQDFH